MRLSGAAQGRFYVFPFIYIQVGQVFGKNRYEMNKADLNGG
jgi:hypothetical protein